MIKYKIDRKIYGRILNLRLKKHMDPDTNGKLSADRHTKFILAPSARFHLSHDLILNDNCLAHNGRSTIVRMDPNATLMTTGVFSFYYGASLEKASLTATAGFAAISILRSETIALFPMM